MKQKIILISSIVFLILFGTIAYMIRKQPTPSKSSPSKVGQISSAPAQQAQLIFSPRNVTMKVGQSAVITAQLKLLASARAQAVDLVASFDPVTVRVATVSAGKLFGIYPINKVKGNTIYFSALSNPPTQAGETIGFTGNGDLATITLEGVKPGVTKLTLTKDTIVAYNGINILSQFDTATVTVK